MQQYAVFLKSALRFPLQTGSVAPSSRYLAQAMLSRLPLEKARCVVELGPGTGPFTQAILDKIGPQTVFFAIERNPELVAFLTRAFPNTEILCESAENLTDILNSKDLRADCIVSGLPLSWLPNDLCERVLDAVHDSLAPHGKFAMFQYIHSSMTPMGRQVHHMLRKRFRHIHVSRTLRNLPPALALTCEK